MKLTPRLLLVLVLCALFSVYVNFSPMPVQAQQEQSPSACPQLIEDAQGLLNCLSVEERVGQLFLVTFVGDSTQPDSPIVDLIVNEYIGGVVLRPQNDNFNVAGGNSAENLAALNAELQRYAVSRLPFADDELSNDSDAASQLTDQRTPVPLLIAIDQNNFATTSTSLNGISALPDALALGATWQPEFARTVGNILGNEIAELGVNMLIGPTLNISDQPTTNPTTDPGTQSFGANPFWVGQMARAYAEGVKEGSDNRVAIVGKFLPGFAGSVGNAEQEIATVRKSIVDMQAFDLQPFFAATASTDTVSNTLDAVMTSHIRYPDLDGNIRDTTPPVSVSPGSNAELFALPELAQWRSAGGVVVSDELGDPALQNFYDDSGTGFPHRQVAKDAFAAGNDLLYLGDFALGGGLSGNSLSTGPIELDNIRDTLDWFSSRYRDEAAFQQQVDAAVLRILELKMRIYGSDFTSQNIAPRASSGALDTDFANDMLVNIPAQALTLISPSQAELQVRLQEPPTADENIVIFTDMRFVQQCSTCPEEPVISEDVIAQRIAALYGPNASNQINPERIQSFSFADLQTYLAADGVEIEQPLPLPTNTPDPAPTVTPEGFIEPTPTATPEPPAGYFVQEALRDADWILFAMLDVRDSQQESFALKQYLAQRSTSDTSKLITFAFDAPYYLDATEILKLTAYYGLFSKSDAFIDVAVRALFGDQVPQGSSPVDIPGIGYTLSAEILPDPQRRIELLVQQDVGLVAPSSDAPIELTGGATLEIQTGTILDKNGNPVPDGTNVRFVVEDFSGTLVDILAERETVGGVATYTYIQPDAFAGRIRIRAQSGEAELSDEVNISGDQLSVATPTPEPTATPEPTPIPATPTPEPTATVPPSTDVPPPTITPMPTEEPVPEVSITLPEGQALLSMIAGLSLVVALSAGIGRNVLNTMALQVRFVLWSILFALAFYNYIALGLPGAGLLGGFGDAARAIISTLTGGTIGILLFYVFNRSI